MIPALRTPGSDSTLATSCWKNRARASAVSYAPGSETSITSAPSRRKPGSTLCNAAKLRAVRPAPTSRISDTATCATTSARWPTERAPEPARPERCSAERTSARAAYSAGSRPETRLLASAAASVSASTRRSSVACSARGKPAGLKATSRRTPQAASKLPKTAPAKARTRPSANSCVTSCRRVAPSAAPRRQLRHAPDGARELQDRDVRRRDQQHERHAALQQQQRGPHLAEHLLFQRPDVGAASRVDLGIAGGEAGRDARHVELRLLQRDAGPEPRHDGEVAPAAPPFHVVGVRQRQRQEGIDALAGEQEAARQDSDDLAAPAVQGHDPAECFGVAAEPALPEIVADHGRPRARVAAAAGVLGAKAAPVRRRDAQRLEEVGGRDDAGDPLHLAAVRAEVEERLRVGRHALEGLALACRVAVVRRRHDVAVLADARDAVPHDHQAIGFAVRQRPQQHRVDDAEDGRVDADAERQRRDGDEGEAGLAQQRADAVAEVEGHRGKTSTTRVLTSSRKRRREE